MLITSEDDKNYLASLSELKCEAVLADQFDQLKRAEELWLALDIAYQSGHYADVPWGNVEVVHGNVGDPGVGGSDNGGDADGGQHTPSNIYNYPSVSFNPIGDCGCQVILVWPEKSIRLHA
jgi:hypothetical protein